MKNTPLSLIPLVALMLAGPLSTVSYATPEEDAAPVEDSQSSGRRNSFSDADTPQPRESHESHEETVPAEPVMAPEQQEASADDREAARQHQAVLAFEQKLKFQKGHIVLGSHVAELNLPDGYRFIGPADSRKVIEEFWGNPPGSGDDVLGMIMPEGVALDDPESWGAIISYTSEGHVKDDDAREIDYSQLLADMKKGSAEQNKERVAKGFESLQLVDWALPPRYDSSRHVLYWAKKLQDSTGPNVLNYDVRFLGREGVLSLMVVGSVAQLPKLQGAIAELPTLANFPGGQRYEDFNADTDKVAEYGLAALVAGGTAVVAAKAGKLAILLVLLKKFGVFLLAGFALAWKKIKGLFGG